MNPMIWHKVAAISGTYLLITVVACPRFVLFVSPNLIRDFSGTFFSPTGSGVAALGLGTYGSHGFRPKDETFKEVWRTASLYHLVHTAALVGAPVAKHPNIFGGLLTAGILAFSGSCYATAYLEDRQYSFLAPFGGFAFIGAWASLIF
ncbi:hypothetical protein ZIOFF_058710 [Zingiber officinale]|uniref:Transmembrane protein 256 homolog n=1 Tax=Zingiber officinale TaxID=94328 RepID=A0A8J5F963_ZINOF|nr:hypothetical protein ZIOFF_058710 [Zingiber officinale]